ncbi:MAG TPA: hypothetical protein VHX66_02780 [Solirubrobacteraceae bacterium]|nr:hypothetical protein [Solirubrobacteraceae bacterium]
MSQSLRATAPGGGPGATLRARALAVPAATWARISFAVISAAAVIAWLTIPTYPIYDTEYYLLWGREIAAGQLPSFTVYEAPTEHPLAVGWGTVMSIFGNAELRLAILCAVISFLVLLWGVYRLTRTAFSPIVAATAVALLMTRFNFMFLAARGYVDISYCAAIVWAAALEIERPRRGTPVFVLLLGAELIRPDAWLLVGLYWLWCAPKADWPRRIGWAAIAAAGPVIWVGLDWIVTGKPLHSLTSTQNTAVALGRTVPLGQLPGTLMHYLFVLAKSPVVAGAIAGIVLSAWFVPRRMFAPFLVLMSGIGTFVVLAGAGLSVIDRYLLMPAVMVLIFCAFALSGWTMLERGLLRRLWALGSLALVALGVYLAASTLSIGKIQTELGFRDSGHTSLVAILNKPNVKRALGCGPVSVPDHKLIPDVRFILNRGANGVVDRGDARYELDQLGNSTLSDAERHGVALYPLALAVARYALTSPQDSPLDQDPTTLTPLGFHWVANTQYYAAYARC